METLLKTVERFVFDKNAQVFNQDASSKSFFYELRGLLRLVQVWHEGFLVLYSYVNRTVEVKNEDKFYEAINLINDEIVSFSMEFNPEEQKIMLKSSVIHMPGVDIEKAVLHFEEMHDKYYNILYERFSNLPEDLSTFSRDIKDQANLKPSNS